jgi:hemerythrin
MTLLQKFKHYSFGIPELDEMHLEIFSLVYLGKYIKSEPLNRELLNTVKKLWDTHTAEEAQLMKRIGFPYINHHLIEHDKLSLEIETRIKNFQPDDNYFMLLDLLDKFTEHFDSVDTNLATYIKDNNIKL